MNANFTDRTITMTATEAKSAGKFGTDDFKELAALRQAFPDFEIIVEKASRRKHDNFSGLTKSYIYDFIKKRSSENNADSDKENLAEFYTLCGKDKEGNELTFAKRASFVEIKAWFLSAYPEVRNFEQADAVDDILKKAKKLREAQKARREDQKKEREAQEKTHEGQKKEQESERNAA